MIAWLRFSRGEGETVFKANDVISGLLLLFIVDFSPRHNTYHIPLEMLFGVLVNFHDWN